MPKKKAGGEGPKGIVWKGDKTPEETNRLNQEVIGRRGYAVPKEEPALLSEKQQRDKFDFLMSVCRSELGEKFIPSENPNETMANGIIREYLPPYFANPAFNRNHLFNEWKVLYGKSLQDLEKTFVTANRGNVQKRSLFYLATALEYKRQIEWEYFSSP